MSLHLILARDSRVLVDTRISLPGKGLFFISVHQVNALFVVNFWLALLCLGSARWFSCSLGCTLSWVGWGRLVAIVAFRSGLYLGRSLSESYKHSKWLFRRTSWCPMASPHPRLIVWELKCLKWLFSSVIAFRSGLYLGRSLSESYKHSKWLFRRTSWCSMASPHPRLIVWELKCLKWLFSSVIDVTGKFRQAHGNI